jgi:hypothetical protein
MLTSQKEKKKGTKFRVQGGNRGSTFRVQGSMFKAEGSKLKGQR